MVETDQADLVKLQDGEVPCPRRRSSLADLTGPGGGRPGAASCADNTVAVL